MERRLKDMMNLAGRDNAVSTSASLTYLTLTGNLAMNVEGVREHYLCVNTTVMFTLVPT